MSAPKRPKSKHRRPPKKDEEQEDLFNKSLHRIHANTADATDAEFEEEVDLARPERRRWWHGFWNFIVGLSLLPFACILTSALFRALSKATAQQSGIPFWMTHEFLMFGVGGAAWLAWTAISLCIWHEPRPVRLYVLGHEWTHAIASWLFHGKVKDIHVSRDGGYIVTDKYNFYIALAPYLWPIYSAIVLIIWGIVGWFDVMPYQRECFLGALGFTWMFHLTFTLWMLPKGQTDFDGPGRVFSFTLIYLANVLLLGLAIIPLAPEVTLASYWDALSTSFLSFYHTAITVTAKILHALGILGQGHSQ